MSHPDIDQGAQHVAGGLDHLGGGAGLLLGHLEVDQLLGQLHPLTGGVLRRAIWLEAWPANCSARWNPCTPAVMADSIRIGTLLYRVG